MPIAQPIEESIVSQVSEWDGVSVEQRRGGRTEFMFAGEDFGHIDDDGSLDLPLSIPVREALVAAGRTEPHPMYGKTGWTTFTIRGEDDVEEATKLLRLAYCYYVLDVSHDDGKASMADDIDVEAELETFGADDDLREAIMAMA
ncbi:luciferase family protein [Halorarius litoreus]|uniref:luciferase domain-containing protein n=1 Tax=Halorarius litoreus TaxID=2962676 RepID=UPI0020CCC1DF|nr:luciferase family protein [Halorarius litoreus]